MRPEQLFLPDLTTAGAEPPTPDDEQSSTFVNNMTLPVHRWFRYSAGFSAEWAAGVIREERQRRPGVRLLDPFAGSATTLLAAEANGVEALGIDSHPFVARIGGAKLEWRSDVRAYERLAGRVLKAAEKMTPSLDYPPLIRNCYDDETLGGLDRLRQAYEAERDDTPASALAWITLVGILRKTSHAGTAQWQYVLPKKAKRNPIAPVPAFEAMSQIIAEDMRTARTVKGPRARLLQTDSRTCDGVPDRFAQLVVTSPPYPNNYDYADATRLEMTFMREIDGWGCLQEKVRRYLIRSCSQHVPEKAVNLAETIAAPELDPIRDELEAVCDELAEIRLTKGGKKTYHLMIACYFRDLAQVWRSLRRVCDSPSRLCFVIGDSAPYGVYVPVVPWLGRLAIAAGFKDFTFEKTRDRNVKWKNRKHRVPLQEGRLWVRG